MTVRLRIVLPALVLALGLVALTLWQVSNSRSFQSFGQITARVETDRPLVALTFDDGPTDAHTQSILDTLAAHEVKASFFLTGREAEANPTEVAAIAAAGHEIGNHSWSHRRMVLVDPGFVAKEIEDTDAAIRAAGYTGPLHFRPPYGKKLFTLPWYLAQTDRHTIMWDVEPESDAAGDTAEAMVKFTIDAVRPGSIIILHAMYDSRETTRAALADIVSGLQAKGFSFVTVSELLAAR